MATNRKARKAPWFRIFLITGAFLLFIQRVHSQYSYDANCREAYEAIMSLHFDDAHKLIAIEKKAEPDNLLPVYLESCIDFLTLTIGEERSVYDRLKDKIGVMVSTLENGRKDSPYYNFCLGEVHLQWAMIRLKFGDYTQAAIEIHKAYGFFSENQKRHPSFKINNIGMGVVHVLVSLVPDNYKWMSNLIGLNGSLEAGLNEIRQVAVYDGPDMIARMYKPQASFYLAFLTLNLQKNKSDAIQLVKLMDDPPFEINLKSPLEIYARATILMKNGFNDEALTVLRKRSSISQTFSFCYLDYLEGMARLNKLDTSAFRYFEQFTARFKGRNYIGAAFQKLAWVALLRGDSVGYRLMINKVLLQQKPVTDEDKQALYEAAGGEAPNLILLRARLLSDGGYHDLAMDELLNNPVRTAVNSKRDLLEYTYRLGRIYHETGNFEKAVQNYQQTVLRGKTESYYFAASAAYQLGLLYENSGAYAKADSAYRMCLSINSREYKTSLHQKAKAGLNRLKTHSPKT